MPTDKHMWVDSACAFISATYKFHNKNTSPLVTRPEVSAAIEENHMISTKQAFPLEIKIYFKNLLSRSSFFCVCVFIFSIFS